MARGIDALNPGWRGGPRLRRRLPAGIGAWLAALIVLALTALPFAALLREAGALPIERLMADTWLRRVLRFSLWQATLSTLLSIGLAIPVALALSHHRRFIGRSSLIAVFGLSLVIPTLSATYGIVAVFGGSGWVNAALAPTGLALPSVYGLGGILLAHVFFNLPLAARVLLHALEGVPQEHWRLSRQLGMGPLARLRLIELPVLMQGLSALAVLIFTLCFTSFAIVMTLGGGPRATTIEVAIYQALRFDFDLPMAVALALLQLALCLGLTLVATTLSRSASSDPLSGGGHDSAVDVPHPTGPVRWLEAVLIAAVALFVLLPLAALLLAGLNPSSVATVTDASTLLALRNTLVAALVAATISLLLAAGLLAGSRALELRHGRSRAARLVLAIGNVILVLPPIVLGTGLFLLLRSQADVFALALPLVIVINALMALPFVLRVLADPVQRAGATHERLCRQLGVIGWQRFRLIDWPVLRAPIGYAAAIAATLSAGDLGAIALFGSDRMTTLPLLLYQRLGSYRLDEAAATAALLLALCLALFFLLQRLIGGRGAIRIERAPDTARAQAPDTARAQA